MLILLPPSEGKTSPRRGKPLDLASLSFPELEQHRAEVLDALVALCTTDVPADAARVLGLGTTQTADVAANARLPTAPTARADTVYSGVLYEALGLGSLTGAARRRATSWLAVTSGLFGLLRPADRVPAYRLSGDVSLPGTGTVSTYWSRRLDESVRAVAGRGLVVDLRSSTYASFWRPAPDLARKVVTLRVLHEVDGTRKAVSHFNKATKGRLVRALLEDGTAPATPARFAAHLRALGWTVEEGPAGRHGTQLDVVVSDL
ncbi:peroxide stress protein YaaA [Nocardioides panacis]|uniref:Peroxide stress protein YaaA n=1 Tax=Nocardioides panacis TaxID=2849501 RepID=A0A975XYP8_9ACTN|nr:peroxide stress protein YaaA [Nocardioides panacis]QWZ06439.1 peroxide stress protein YaaA [Nocardioides panacis]